MEREEGKDRDGKGDRRKGRRNENGNKLRMVEKGTHESRERIRG